MLFEMTIALLGISIAGFGAAAWWDLRTTEFPDWLPYAMIAGGLGTRALASLLTWDFSYVISSALVGCIFLGFGLMLYWLRQWGDGDAWLLGAMGFLFPDSGWFMTATMLPFPAAMLFNFFLVAFFYLLVYSVFLGVRSSDISRGFIKELRGSAREIGRLVGGFTAACIILVAIISWRFGVPPGELLYVLVFPPLLLSIMVFTRYGRFVEANLFKRKVPASRLREGDVLASDRWRGLSAREVAALRKKGGDVWIKEGVRFAPVFLATVLVTLMWGSLLAIFMAF
jgi:hypothetical protein